MSNKYIYHYHATFQLQANTITNIDGILTCDREIDSMDRYAEVKKLIAGDYLPADKIIICSLSKLKEPK